MRALWSAALFVVLGVWGAAWVCVATSPLVGALPVWVWLALLVASALPLELLYRRTVPATSPSAGSRFRGRFRDGGRR